MQKKNEVTNIRKYNTKLYLIYKMVSNDLLFFYAVDFLFLTQVKGIAVSKILLAEAIYTVFRILLQIPCTLLVNKIGNKLSLIIGNISLAMSVVLIIFCNDFQMLIISNLFAAFAWTLKGITAPALLYDILPSNEKSGNLYSKIDGKGTSYYYYMDAVGSILSGFLFVINPYIPIIICLALSIYGIYVVIKIKDVQNTEINDTHNMTIRSEFRDLKYALKYMMNSRRLSSLLLFYSTVSGFMIFFGIYRKSLLADLQVPAQYFGIIFAILGIISALSSSHQIMYHKRYKNRTLTRLSMSFIGASIIIGLVPLIGLPLQNTIVIVMAMFIIQYIVIEPFYSLSKRYLGNFSDSNLRIKIYSITSLFQSLVRVIIAFISSFMLSITSTATTIIIMSYIFGTMAIFMLIYMKNKVGLKPEEYSKEDIEYLRN
ncbi:MAG: MFS transporter [Clostridia bacterium]|nr:MFS transporter [Clostridia bacterium]